MLDHVEYVGARKEEERIVDCFMSVHIYRTRLATTSVASVVPFSLVRILRYFQVSVADF